MMLLKTLLLCATSSMAQSGPAARLPEGPLSRTLSTSHRVSMTVTINYPPQVATTRSWTMPLIVNGPWSTLRTGTFSADLTAGRDTITVPASQALGQPGPLGQADVSVKLPPVQKWPLNVRVEAVITSWSSAFDDAAAMQIPWPAAWPPAVETMLGPSPLIESGSDIVQESVKTLTKGNPRSVSPAFAAKAIVQDACARFKVVEPRMSRSAQGKLRGIAVVGAETAMEAGRGSVADLTCICVAMLRAAGLPARPVIGLGGGLGRLDEFGVWAEVYLPECGWVPFDPDRLRQQAIATLKPERRWGEGFGTMPQLQARVPMAWSFAPGDGNTAFDSWAIWGWDRFLPGASFPITIQDGAIATEQGPWRLNPARRTPSFITLERTGAAGR